MPSVAMSGIIVPNVPIARAPSAGNPMVAPVPPSYMSYKPSIKFPYPSLVHPPAPLLALSRKETTSPPNPKIAFTGRVTIVLASLPIMLSLKSNGMLVGVGTTYIVFKFIFN
jgi:hypothetical protein